MLVAKLFTANGTERASVFRLFAVYRLHVFGQIIFSTKLAANGTWRVFGSLCREISIHHRRRRMNNADVIFQTSGTGVRFPAMWTYKTSDVKMFLVNVRFQLVFITIS